MNKILGFAVLALAATTLIACGGSDLKAATGTVPASAPQAQAAPVQPAAQPQTVTAQVKTSSSPICPNGEPLRFQAETRDEAYRFNIVRVCVTRVIRTDAQTEVKPVKGVFVVVDVAVAGDSKWAPDKGVSIDASDFRLFDPNDRTNSLAQPLRIDRTTSSINENWYGGDGNIVRVAPKMVEQFVAIFDVKVANDNLVLLMVHNGNQLTRVDLGPIPNNMPYVTYVDRAPEK